MDFDYFNGRARDVVAEHNRRVRYKVHPRFRLRDAHDPLDISIEAFIELFRMPQDIFLQLLEFIRPYVLPRRSPLAIPLYTKGSAEAAELLCALSFYATVTHQEHNGTNMHHPMSQASVSYCIEEITNALNHPLVFTRFVKFPLTRAERHALIDRNAQMGLPGVLGLIDGTIIRISHPPGPHLHYFSRKGYPSLNTMIVCDTELNILNDREWSPPRSHVHNNSALRNVMEVAFQEDRCWLLGDAGYPRQPWLMVPVRNAVKGTPQYFFNLLHTRVRMVVERLDGGASSMTTHSPICPYRPEKAGKIINACVVLHNILTRCRVAVPIQHAFYQDEPEPDYIVPPEDDVDAFFDNANAVQAELVDHANWYMNRHLH
ncbi:Putative nuclease [Frankliniella fusca]|uniref:Nuclease n=1 Tax=Frankliniella fusca TaxID=407009 RepID=A0AAE1HMJ6_9NEOP|nr:Putative nuclease [Frankliniella fusca]